jgi:hypothetical protein
MADWKQITARIRRARTGKDPATQLSNLYEKTHDAMVAFELARHFETASQNAEAAKWYSTAAERFRRADWKTKAQEAAVRLGGESGPESQTDFPSLAIPVIGMPEPGLPFVQNAAVFEAMVEPAESDSTSSEAPETEAEASADSSPLSKSSADPLRRRRGRRGGRNRRRGAGAKSQSGTPGVVGDESNISHRPTQAGPATHSEDSDESPPTPPSRAFDAPAPRPADSAPDAGGIALRGRYGDPGLSSRLSLLEMQFRRLLTCAPVKLDEADRAPAGPGVFLVTDSDLTSYYYVEACQTLRIAIPNLLRGGSSRRGADSVKPQLADHLGIAESRVGKYLSDHCVVRWLQLDDDASHFAHFVIAVLRPVLNE